MVMGNADDVVDGIYRSERIADVGNADDARLVREELLVSLHVQLAAVVHRDDLQSDAALCSLKLPGHDVAVVLHRRDDYLVAFTHESLAERRHHQIDALRRAACEDYLFRLGRVDEAAHRLACCLMKVGGTLREIVHATMHVGIGIEIFVAHGIEHAKRFLRGGGVVEIDKRTVVYGARENREVGADFIYIVHLRILVKS